MNNNLSESAGNQKNGISAANSFNALRFFFCLIVIARHYLDSARIEFAYIKLLDSHISVCAFFILSGYWVTKSYLKSRNVRMFYKKRFMRIFPLYFLSVFGFACLLVFFSDLSASEYFSSLGFWKYLFWNALTLNFIAPSLPGVFAQNTFSAVNGSLWTIKVEVGFYLILPALVFFLDRLSGVKKKNIFLAVIYIISVLWSALLKRYASTLGLPGQLSWQLPGFMSFFASGMAFVYNEDALVKIGRFMIFPALIVFAAHYITGTEILMPFALSAIIMFLGNRLRFLSEIGQPADYSYGMYLFHFPLINIFVSLGFPERSPVFSLLIITATTLAMAFIAEKYIQRKINRLAGR